MARRIGFGNQERRKTGASKFIKLLVVFAIMDAIAVALIRRSFMAENWIGVGVGIGFCVLASVLMVRAILRHARSALEPPRHNRSWEMDAEDSRD